MAGLSEVFKLLGGGDDFDFDFETSDVEEDFEEDADSLPIRGRERDCDEGDDGYDTETNEALVAIRAGGSSCRDPPVASIFASQRYRKKPMKEFAWGKRRVHRPVHRNSISFGPGVRSRQLKANPTKLDCFLAVFPIEALDLMVDMTNKNYRRKLAKREAERQAKDGTSAPWTDVTMEEMKAFIGLSLAMGILKLPRLSMYWRRPPDPFASYLFARTMSQDRFLNIHRHFHFSEPAVNNNRPNTNQPQDKLRKIRCFTEILRKKFLSIYSPRRDLSIDESMIPFEGQISFQRYIPAERARDGIKVFVLVEAETGYISNFTFHVGEERRNAEYQHLGVSGQVVFDLLEPFLGEGRHVYMDNYYTSPHLLDELFQRNTYACGTIRSCRRGFPKDILMKVTGTNSVPRGYMSWRMTANAPLLCYSWNDKKAVYIMSTIHIPERDNVDSPVVKRRKTQNDTGPQITYPQIIKDYNNYMRGVDFNRQLRKYYNINGKSRTWYKKIFGYLLEVSVHNARVLFENLSSKVCPIKFREELITALIGQTVANKLTSPPPIDSVRLLKDGPHLPFLGERSSKCICCRQRSKASNKAGQGKLPVGMTKCRCSKCEQPLCMTKDRNCFKMWHQKDKLWP